MMSRKCNPDWHMAGTSNDEKNADGTYKYGCESWKSQCNSFFAFYVTFLQDTPDGFESHLNCPQCGCTPGQFNAPSILEISRSLQGYDKHANEFLKELELLNMRKITDF